MKTRKIQGPDIQAALREVRRALGADAVIMSTRETAEGIEVIAAAPPRDVAAPAPRKRVQSAPAPRKRSSRRGAPAHHPAFATLVSGLARPAKPPAPRPDVSLELEGIGLSADVRAAIAESVADVAPELLIESAYRSLQDRIQTDHADLMRSGGRFAILGGTGVGKTTTIAKLAAHFTRRHGCDSVALLNADQYRIGASDQLRRFARLLAVPVVDVHDGAELNRALGKLKDRKLVLVDTAGIAHGDVHFNDQLELLGNAKLDCYLALSMNTQTAVVASSVRAYSPLKPRGLIFTKEDEALSLGAGLSMAVRHGLAVSFVTTGPNVPADIRIAQADKLVARARAMARVEAQVNTSAESVVGTSVAQGGERG
ncbi:MAG: flagellar biosynthesis GTPase FlhF [Gammaproteobacteria bacterium]|jgi:flagellar biosynthesis GTPase FlhF